MAKRNKASKKRQKKQLMKRVAKTAAGMAAIVESEETPFIKTWLNPVIIDSGRTLPRMDLYLGKYSEANTEYQKELDAVYAGTVVVIERFLNHKSTLLHHCTECSANFYSRPEWLLNEKKQPHVCYTSLKHSHNKVVATPKKKRLTEADTMEMVALAEQGMTKTMIAKIYGVTRQTVINRLSKAGF
ncbi:helix-turn-helix domain-containing protein [Bacillus idriensis]|uniref:Helix-turn-helix domain-containing protein n=1 Tax=Metabacillus idriensis TaxID=324768 RepID=A0A6I2M2T0_9BACI|nr:helix-turn-helix domain-containing protein [Metabacillus idriensis]MRX52368.1 helix-turn-helix domain-containing protein [Metabacillus idriensis]